MATNRDSLRRGDDSGLGSIAGPSGGDNPSNQRRPVSASTSSRDGVSRILDKLEKRVADGEYYEAHQLYRTLYFRYVSQQKYEEAIELLMKGALTLLEAKQASSGADLALLAINTMEKYKMAVSADSIAKVATLHKKLVNLNIEQPDFVMAAMRWAKQSAADNHSLPVSTHSSSHSVQRSPGVNSSNNVTEGGKMGYLLLHGRFAATYWQERDYTQARYHFVRSHDGEGCASMLIEYHITQGFPSEVDLFIAQTVFQFLCLRNKITAEVCFNYYTRLHPQVEPGPPFLHPLLNFLWLLLIALDSGSLTTFTVLCEQYNPSLMRDSSYHDYIARIGQLFFHIPAPQSSNAGIFGNLLSSIFNMEEDGDDERSLLESEDLD